jgi:L-threonylcarbamoyladenylate synthase
MMITSKDAAPILHKGEVIAYPTEAVYGLGCDPFNKEAVKRLLKLKRRHDAKGFILIAASWRQVEDLVKPLPINRLEGILATWPGPVTWIFPASPKVPAWIKGEHATVAIRVSAHRTVQAICKSFGGPIVSTSANLSGFPPARTRKELLKQFASSIGFIVCGRVGRLIGPTPIYDAVSGKMIRPAVGADLRVRPHK